MELDLPSANCTEFSLSSQFSMSSGAYDAIDSLIGETGATSGQDVERRIARYGSKYDTGDATIGIVGVLTREPRSEEGLYFVDLRYFLADEALPSPPEGFIPVADLLQAIGSLPDEISINCEATFAYELGAQFQSRVVLPIPLLLADHYSSHPLTHIESVTLSRREDGGPTHTVVVEPENDGAAVNHFVEFTTTNNLTLGGVQQIYEMARRLSLSLMTRKIEE